MRWCREKAECRACHSGSTQCQTVLVEGLGELIDQLFLKSRLYCYSGLVRATEQHTITIEKTVLLAVPRRCGVGEGRLHPARPNGEAPGYSGGMSREEEHRARQAGRFQNG